MTGIPKIDTDACIACGLCVEGVPEVFRMNSEGLAEVYDPTGATEEKIQEAIDACPVTCIYWD